MSADTPAARRSAPSATHGAGSLGSTASVAAVIMAALVFVAAGAAVVVSGLIVPGWVRWLFVAVWFVGLERLVAWRHRPLLAIGVPVAMWAVLIVTVIVGDVWFGWTA